jgi:hypothetical protein
MVLMEVQMRDLCKTPLFARLSAMVAPDGLYRDTSCLCQAQILILEILNV